MVEFVVILMIALFVAYGIVCWHYERNTGSNQDKGLLGSDDGLLGHKADKMSSTER